MMMKEREFSWKSCMNVVCNYMSVIMIIAMFFSGRAWSDSDLCVSSDGHYLEKISTGEPFLWVGDTAWQLFAKLSREDADYYLSDRANRGFTVIFTGVVTWEQNIPNAYGNRPFNSSGDLTAPNDAYFQHVDWIMNKALEKGLHVAFLPVFLGPDTWAWISSQSEAYTYGQYLGSRYQNQSNIIWTGGGDMWAYYNDEEKNRWLNLMRGIAVGVTGSEDYSRCMM